MARRVAGDPIRLGGVGSLVRWKNWGLVLEALAQLPADVRERFRFSQIGGTDGSSDSEKYAQELVDLTRQLALGTVVEWRGVQGSADGLLAEIDCLLIVSTNEPFSIAMIEAWQMGVPVLAADSGGARDAVSPGKTGWLFRTGAAACLARALARLAATDCLAQVRIEPGDLQPFTSPMVAAQWAKVYASVLSPQRPQR
ncbi:MAG: epsD 1 [Verrucomicrobia bacterium]|nr:epsD 1 [Verrucomicrobiota bacterium]